MSPEAERLREALKSRAPTFFAHSFGGKESAEDSLRSVWAGELMKDVVTELGITDEMEEARIRLERDPCLDQGNPPSCLDNPAYNRCDCLYNRTVFSLLATLLEVSRQP